jgi:peroxiredoxin
VPGKPDSADLIVVLGATLTESGKTLLELVDEQPVLLVFLRHFGCAFCRQAIDDVSKVRAELAARGVQVVFVHLGTPERAKPYFDYYGLADVERVSNPDGSLYRDPVFALARVSLFQLIRPAVWIGWFRGALFQYGVGLKKEDIQQMPGVFFLRDRAIANVFRYRTIADRPDYLKVTRSSG